MIDREAYLTYAQASGVKESTARKYARELEVFDEYCQQHGVANGISGADAELLQSWIDKRAETISISLQRILKAALTLFFKQQGIEDYSNHCELHGVEHDPVIPSMSEVLRLIESPSNETAQGIRDRALLGLLGLAGLRVMECIHLTARMVSVEEPQPRLIVPWRSIDIALSGDCLKRLTTWLRVRALSHGEIKPDDPVFPDLTRNKAKYIVFAASKAAEADLTLVDLRTAFIVMLLQRKMPIRQVALAAGMNERFIDRYVMALMPKHEITQPTASA